MLSALCIALLVTASAVPQRNAVSPAELYKMAAPSVVLIEIYGDDGKVSGNGSGFIVSSDGAILTNYHVIQHTKRATVRLANGDAYDDVSVLDIDKRKDIALIKVKAVNLQPLGLGKSNSVEIGDTLYALGNPLGETFQNTLSEGILGGIRQGDGYRLFQLSTPISHGSSGSPVFNSRGEVVGIIEATIEEGQNLNFAIPIDYAAGMLTSNTQRSLESTYEPLEKTPDKISAVSPQPTIAPQPSENLKLDALEYVGQNVGIWNREDAQKELGEPFARRDGVVGQNVVGDIYKYKSPQANFDAIELNFDRNSKKLVAGYFYYMGTVAWATIRTKLGTHYEKVKLKGAVRPGYLYQIGQRHVFITVDSQDNIINVGVW